MILKGTEDHQHMDLFTSINNFPPTSAHAQAIIALLLSLYEPCLSLILDQLICVCGALALSCSAGMHSSQFPSPLTWSEKHLVVAEQFRRAFVLLLIINPLYISDVLHEAVWHRCFILSGFDETDSPFYPSSSTAKFACRLQESGDFRVKRFTWHRWKIHF